MSAELSSAGLEAARRQLGLSVDELWVRYFGNGGTATIAEFQSFLADEPWPAALQYDIAVSALNDRFGEIDLDHPVPYALPARSGSPP
jgi:hypothetical protein